MYSPQIFYKSNALVTILKRSLLLVLFFLLEFLLFFHFKEASDSGLSDGVNGYLRRHVIWQFFIVANIRTIIANALFILVVVILIISSTQARSKFFIRSLVMLGMQWKILIINVIVCISLLIILAFTKSPVSLISNPYSFSSLIYAFSPLLWFTYLYTLVALLFPINFLFKWILRNGWTSLFISVSVASCANHTIFNLLTAFWSDLLLGATLKASIELSKIFGLTLSIFSFSPDGYPIIGTSRFQVEISPACSGYEGMLLAILFLSLYFFLQRNLLKMPRSFVILPVALFAMFLLNAIRIIILVAIGDFYSPQLALDGFHVIGGWLNLLIVLSICFLALNKVNYFSQNLHLSTTYRLNNLPFLFPLMALILGGLLTQAFSPDFPWLYPIPIGLASFILFYFRKDFLGLITKPSPLSYIIGTMVYFIWITIVPVDPGVNLHFLNKIQSSSILVVLCWIFFRIIGASVVVPIAEEIFFRGFLFPYVELFACKYFRKFFMPLLNSDGIKMVGLILSLIVTSLLFGILHSDVMAGSLAGFAFGIAYLYRRKLADAVLAHATANLLLALNVVYFGNWSYW